MRMKFSHFLILLPLLSPPAYATDPQDDDLPKVHLMSCQGQCANFVPAKPVDNTTPRFPSDQSSWTRIFSEANLRLLYTVGPDGKVRDDVLILSLAGPREFADITIQKIKTWTFEPATSDGKPVAQSRIYRINYLNNPNNHLNGRVFEVTQGWNAFKKLTEEGKPEEARGKLEDVLKNVGLTFNDRTTVASTLADLAYKRGDYLEARRLALIATVVTVPELPVAIQESAWKNRIKADLALRDVSDTLFSLDEMQHTFRFSDPTLPGLEQAVRKAADAESMLTVQAQIPPAEEGDVYTFIPYRRSFTFQKVQGSLQKFVLSCNQATMESNIAATAQWRIPDTWDGCSVYVRGTPGTKFAVLQPKQ
jgi:hypothetical protein